MILPLKKLKVSDDNSNQPASQSPEDQSKAVIPEATVPDWESEVEKSLQPWEIFLISCSTGML